MYAPPINAAALAPQPNTSSYPAYPPPQHQALYVAGTIGIFGNPTLLGSASQKQPNARAGTRAARP